MTLIYYLKCNYALTWICIFYDRVLNSQFKSYFDTFNGNKVPNVTDINVLVTTFWKSLIKIMKLLVITYLDYSQIIINKNCYTSYYSKNFCLLNQSPGVNNVQKHAENIKREVILKIKPLLTVLWKRNVRGGIKCHVMQLPKNGYLLTLLDICKIYFLC